MIVSSLTWKRALVRGLLTTLCACGLTNCTLFIAEGGSKAPQVLEEGATLAAIRQSFGQPVHHRVFKPVQKAADVYDQTKHRPFWPPKIPYTSIALEESYRLTGRLYDPSLWGGAVMGAGFTLGMSEIFLFPQYSKAIKEMDQETHEVTVWYDPHGRHVMHYASFEPRSESRSR